MRKVWNHFLPLLALMSFVTTSRADEPQEDEVLSAYRREVTNLQFNKDETVGLIRLSKPSVKDETLATLSHFPDLKYLAIVSPNVTDAGLKHISALKNLDTLFISEASMTGKAFDSIRGLTNLERISLTKLPLAGIPANSVNELSKVVSLSLAETEITDSAMGEICKLQTLESLLLDNTKITDEGLSKLSKLPHLNLLSLCNCVVSGNGFNTFSSHKSLKHLVLSGAAITSDGLAHIAKISSLETLELYNTDLPSAAVDSLRATLDGTKVFFHNEPENLPVNAPISSDKENDQSDLVEIAAPINSRIDEKTVPDFQRHVIPLLGRLGCNSRSCHGSFQGRGGFRLSMFGYDFDLDHENLAERIDVDSPSESLIVTKPTSADDHEGGKRFESGSWQQQLLQRWITSGATNRPKDAATFVRLDVTPKEIEFSKSGQSKQIRVVAVWSDNSREDVTSLSRFETKDDAIANVDPDGLVTAMGAGDTHIIAYYDNGIQPIQVIMPYSNKAAFAFEEVPTPSKIDEVVIAKLQKLGIPPSELSSDTTFLRRVSLDISGSLPTPDEITSFVSDTSSDKRKNKIDELLEHPAYVAWWTNRLCDLTGSNAGYLGSTEMALPVSLQWQAWIERRVKENVGWDKIAYDMITATSRNPGQTYREFIQQQSEFTRRSDPRDYAALDNPMPHYWFRDNIKIPSDKALSFGYVFMGLRLDCAQCHKHPFDRWSQQDFNQFTEFFTRIRTGLAPDAVATHDDFRHSLGVPSKLNTAALRRQSYLRIAAEGRAIPWREVWVEPATKKPQPAKLLGSSTVNLADVRDPRIPLAHWLQTEPNHYLAKAFVNRIWSNYFGTGIINPTDDLNLANPPSHPELIEYLSEQFVKHGYDMKWLHRTITNSRTYQLSWKPSESNIGDQRNYSHATLRRLPAEVAIDAIHRATESTKALKYKNHLVASRKIRQHPKSYQTRSIDYSLLVFGKSLRTANCDCERSLAPTLPQALYVRNDRELLELIDRKDGWIAEIKAAQDSALNQDISYQNASLIEQAYLRTLSRKPHDWEAKAGLEHLRKANDKVDGIRDLLWALINSQEFIANH